VPTLQALAPGDRDERIVDIAPSSSRLVAWKLGELWEYRELLWFLVWRDTTIKYKQTALGVGWAIVQPLTATIVFSLIFGRLAQLPSDGVPYPVFTLTALLAWNFSSGGVARAAVSLVGSANLITKVYFPRLLIPTAATLGGALDFVVGIILLVAACVWYGVRPTAAVLAFPLFVVLAFMTSLGIGLWLAALNARYRDVSHVVPFLIQVWMYASPVAYSSRLIPAEWRLAYALNPMVGVLEGFRWTLLGVPLDRPATMVASASVATLVLVSGITYFRSQERTVADVI
jgi:lipopolysaccharide transport system permease protein